MSIATIEEIAMLLANYTGCPAESYECKSRIYHDAGLYGSDFVEFLDEFSEKWGVDLDGVDMSQYTPDEVPGRKSRENYKSLTIENLVDLSSLGSWQRFIDGR